MHPEFPQQLLTNLKGSCSSTQLHHCRYFGHKKFDSHSNSYIQSQHTSSSHSTWNIVHLYFRTRYLQEISSHPPTYWWRQCQSIGHLDTNGKSRISNQGRCSKTEASISDGSVFNSTSDWSQKFSDCIYSDSSSSWSSCHHFCNLNKQFRVDL